MAFNHICESYFLTNICEGEIAIVSIHQVATKINRYCNVKIAVVVVIYPKHVFGFTIHIKLINENLREPVSVVLVENQMIIGHGKRQIIESVLVEVVEAYTAPEIYI